jgi:hypothetical protein
VGAKPHRPLTTPKEVDLMTYLRFTQQEYRAIAAACRSVPLSDDF